MDEKISSIFSVQDSFHVPEIGSPITPEQAMRLAIWGANFGAAHVSPNPLVGCVIVDQDHHFLSFGYHRKVGEAHAEVNALNLIPDALKNRLQGATFYVTLEPCAHEGRTPSCAKHLAQLPIKKVVYGLIDPNPLVSGHGAQILESSGKIVERYSGPLESDLQQLPEIFLKNFTEKKPFVALKVATSLDGQLAHISGESKWITSEKSRLFSHELRSRYDAVLVGKETLLSDDPQLDVRHPLITKSNLVIILDRSGEILDRRSKGQIFKCFEKRSPEHVHVLNETTIGASLDAAWKLGIRSIYVEGGAQIFSSFLAENLVDRIHCFIAPVLIGAGSGIAWTKSFQIESMQDRVTLKNVKHRSIESDIYMTGRL